MTCTRQRRIPASLALSALVLALPLLSGCQGRKIIARVNNQTITEDDFIPRVERLRTIPQGVNLDCGGLTLYNMIRTDLIDQLAADPAVHAAPSPEQVKTYGNLLKHMLPKLQNQMSNGLLSDEDFQEQVRIVIEMVGIGTDGAKAEEADVQATYDDLKAKNQANFPASYSVRLLPVDTLVNGQKILDQLKKTGDFKQAAQTLQMSPDRMASVGKQTLFLKDELPPKLTEALDRLSPGQFTPDPVGYDVPNPSDPKAKAVTQYVIAQLVSKEAMKPATIDDMRPQLQQLALEKKFPQLNQHFAIKLADITTMSQKKGSILIYIDRYKAPVTDFMMSQANSMVQGGAPPPAGGPGGPQ